MEKYQEIGQFHGAVLVARQGEIVFKRGFGEANREWGIPNTPEAKYRLGSVTKSLTASLVLSLRDQGLIDLSGTISQYLPEFRKDVGTVVTVHHLLTHSSGMVLPSMSREEYWDLFARPLSTEEILERLCSQDLAFTPGERFQYSSAGYMVLGAIVEKATGRTYAEALAERILQPSGMLDTGVDDPELILARRATGYQTNYGLGTARYKYMPSSFSSGSLYSTVDDLLRWSAALDAGKLMDESSLRLLFERHLGAGHRFFGYGWFLDDWEVGDSTVPVAYHGGDVSGFCAFVLRSVDGRDLVVLLRARPERHAGCGAGASCAGRGPAGSAHTEQRWT